MKKEKSSSVKHHIIYLLVSDTKGEAKSCK